MKVALTGSTGRLGRELMRLRPDWRPLRHDVTAWWMVSGGFDVLLHLAAMTSVPQCERDRDLAWRVNVCGTANAVEWCLRTGARMVFVSSSYAVRPANWYGRTKAAGEGLAASAPSALIVRAQFKERPYPYDVAPTDAFARALYADEVAARLAELVESGASGLRGIWGARRSLFDFARESRPEVRPCLRRSLPHRVPADCGGDPPETRTPRPSGVRV